MQLQEEARKQAELTQMRRVATALLGVAALVWAVSLGLDEETVWVGFVRAGAEAAMVGAIADWFAVTALFRHPLGIPIPHTAIVPTRKDQIGRSLGRFVEHNFLAPELLAARIRSLDVVRHLAEWMREPEHSRRLARHATGAVATVVRSLDDEEMRHLVERSIATRVEAVEAAPLVGRTLALVGTSDRRRELFDSLLRMVAAQLEESQAELRDRVDRELPWWVPAPVDEKIYRKIMAALENTLQEVAADPDHPWRLRFDDRLQDFIRDLQSAPDTIARGEALKREILARPELSALAKRLWGDIRDTLLGADPATDSPLGPPLERGLARFAGVLLEDDALRERLELGLERAVTRIVGDYRHEVANLIAHTVEQWDPHETSRKIELQVGRDLQFIRINGTLVGGLVGVLIHALTLAF